MSERPTFPVGINVFVLRDGKLLLGKRKSDYHDGEWGLPGGHLERGEHAYETAARELEEETGLRADRFVFTCTDVDVRTDGNHYIHFGFEAIGVTGEPALAEPDKCYQWGWFPLDALPAPLFIGHEKLIRAYRSKTTFIE